MLILRGAPACSDFRLRKLSDGVSADLARPVDIYAEFMHFAELEQALETEERRVLDRLLTYGPRLSGNEPAGALVLVTPRPGTISPWSSKATDIAQNCGLSKIRRIERGVAYYLETPGPDLSRDELTAVSASLSARAILRSVMLISPF